MEHVYKLNDNEILYFLHIPKTAGTSMVKVLDDQFFYYDICPEEKWDDLIKKPTQNLSKYKLLRGHFGFRIDSIFTQKPIYITMLRHPVERTLSAYEHIRRTIDKTLFLKIFSDKNELTDFFKDPETRGVFINSQVRHIGLDIDVPSILKSKNEIKNFYFQYAKFFINPNINDEKLLDIAKKRLSQFSFVGITERFEESLMLLSYTFGWNSINYIPKERITINRINPESISNELMNQIKDDTKYDLELYNFVLKIFEKRFSTMVKELKEKYLTPELEKLPFTEMMFNLLEKHRDYCFRNIEKQANTLDYNFDQPIDGNGWHTRQVKPKEDIVYRWSGPETTSRIRFPLVPNEDMVIEIQIVNFLYIDILQSLTLDVNNTRIELKVNKAENKKRIFRGIIPKSVFQNNSRYIRLKFEVNRTESPNSKNSKFQDKRLLGLAFQKIKIFPKNAKHE